MSFYRTSLVLIIFFALILVSCTRRSVRSDFAPVYFTDQVAVPILPVESTSSLKESSQHIEGRYGEKTFSADAFIAANDSLFSVFLAGGFGTTIAELQYTPDSISFKSSVLDTKKVKPEYIVADFQFCFASTEILREHFSRTPLIFQEEKSPTGFKRFLMDGNKPVVLLEKIGNEYTLTNSVRNYSYHITVAEE